MHANNRRQSWNSWNSWQKSQSWTPQPPQQQQYLDRRAKTKAAWDKEYQQCLEEIQADIHPDAPPQPRQAAQDARAFLTFDQPKDTEPDPSELRKKAAARAKAAQAYKASLGSEATVMHAMLDAEIRESKALAQNGKTLGATIDEATQNHAASKVKVQRAMRHLSEAKERYDTAIAAEKETKVELDRVRIYARTSHSSASSVRGVCQSAVQSMATTLTELREKATFFEGTTTVDASLLETLVAQVASLAVQTSPLKKRKMAHEHSEMSQDLLTSEEMQAANAEDPDPYMSVTDAWEDHDHEDATDDAMSDAAIAKFFKTMKLGRGRGHPHGKVGAPRKPAAPPVGFRKAPVQKDPIVKPARRVTSKSAVETVETVVLETPARTEEQIAAAQARTNT